jgi:hypothetical protein
MRRSGGQRVETGSTNKTKPGGNPLLFEEWKWAHHTNTFNKKRVLPPKGTSLPKITNKQTNKATK